MKTAQELGIEDWEWEALQKTREFLQMQRPPDINDGESHKGLPDGEEAMTRFNMNYPVQAFDCGTAMCIGGFVRAFGYFQLPAKDTIQMSFLQARDIELYVNYKNRFYSPLQALFYPGDPVNYRFITAEQAACAITNFLEEGDPAWLTIEGIVLDPDAE